MTNFEEFRQGALDGAADCGMALSKIERVLADIAPEGKQSDWVELVDTLMPDEARYLGHQFACVVFNMKKSASLSNLFRVMDIVRRTKASPILGHKQSDVSLN